jgi:sugar lactone lactonase YvrE
MRRTLSAVITCFCFLSLSNASGAADIERIAKGLQFPEGTIFVGNDLYFVDYSASDVLRLDHGKVKTVWHQDGCGANGLVQVPDALLVACFDSGTVVKISLDGKLLKTIRKDGAGTSFTAPNDFAADAKGGVYFTTSGSDGTDMGKVFYLSSDQTVREVASGIHFANGIAVSPNGAVLYVAETHASRLLSFAISGDGTLSERHEFVKFVDVLKDSKQYVFHPDSMRIDRSGNLFVALYDGGGYAVIRPDGTLIKHVDLPAPHHTNLAIAPDGQSIIVTAVYDSPNGYVGELYRLVNPVNE